MQPMESLQNEIRSYKHNIVPDLKQQIESYRELLQDREEQIENLKLSYSILEDKYKIEKYNKYDFASHRSRIEELEDNLRSQRIDYRDRPLTLKSNRSDIPLPANYLMRSGKKNSYTPKHGS